MTAGAPPKLDQPLIWIDLEMTGLDPDHDLIVEVAVIVTDGSLGVIVEGPELVVGAPDEALAAMDPIVTEMHARSGLTEAVRASATTVQEAEQAVLDWLVPIVPQAGSAPLAGNSVHADRMFLRKYMPRLHSHLHYRNVDVSTLKELARRWMPTALDGAPGKAGAHRALADIRESIAEMAHYRETLMVAAAQDPVGVAEESSGA